MLPLANVAAHGRDLDADQYWRGDLHARSFVLSFVFDFRALPSLLIPFVGIPFFVFFGKCGGWHRPNLRRRSTRGPGRGLAGCDFDSQSERGQW